MADAYSYLRNVPLFAELDDADLEQICREVEEVRLAAGEILFEEGSPGQQAYLIREGLIEIYKEANGHSVELAVRQPGEMIGEMSPLESTPRSASGRAMTDSLLYAIGQEQIDRLLRTSPSAARNMLHTVMVRLRNIDLALNQSEKMAQLGTLTAGIAHELNNPASAVKRGAEQFKSNLTQLQHQISALSACHFSSEQLGVLSEMALKAGPANYLNPLERSDREAELEDWLDSLGVENAWEQAPLLVNLGHTPDSLKGELAIFPQETLPVVLDWITCGAGLYHISDEISQGAGRISEIVKALKSYVYLDQAPVQSVSIQEGLENTLVILRYKLKQGIAVERDYDPAVPLIQAYASELNQVWTNIIDNAIDAMEGQGKITLRTRYQDPWVVVDIADDGPGIPQEILPKLFNPFFTTKPMGKGTGLGLNISYNIIHKHGGDIKVDSKPGETHFAVWLPLDFKKIKETAAHPPGDSEG